MRAERAIRHGNAYGGGVSHRTGPAAERWRDCRRQARELRALSRRLVRASARAARRGPRHGPRPAARALVARKLIAHPLVLSEALSKSKRQTHCEDCFDALRALHFNRSTVLLDN